MMAVALAAVDVCTRLFPSLTHLKAVCNSNAGANVRYDDVFLRHQGTPTAQSRILQLVDDVKPN